MDLSLHAFLLASSKEALKAALTAASEVTSEQMYEQFYIALSGSATDKVVPQSEALAQQEQASKQILRGKRRITQERSTHNNFRGWQAIPALRKLHNIALWLRNSSIHSDMWDNEVSLRIGIDNDTRWGSWYRLIDNLLRKQQIIKQFLLDHDKEIGADNMFTASDWEILSRTHKFLQPFTSATLWAEGASSTLSQTLTIMDGLLRHYEKNKVCTSLYA
jgi:hypothetical protein